MRRIYLLAAAVAMLLFALAPAAQAEVEVNESVPFEFVGWPPCGGDAIGWEGTVHILLTSTIDEAGNAHFVGQSNYQNVKVVGLDPETLEPTGTNYVFRDVEHSVTNIRPSDPEDPSPDGELTAILNARIIRLGEDGTPSDDFLLHTTGHFTQASNGEVTSDFQNVIIECN